MDPKPTLNDEDRENLVAYLDGELEVEAARDLEGRLQLDPAARQEAEALKQAWDLLDYLPRPEVSSTFTNRTLDRIAAVRPSQSVTTVSVRRWVRWLGWVAAVLLAFGVGYAGAGFLPREWSPFGREAAPVPRELPAPVDREDWQVAVRHWDQLLDQDQRPVPSRFADFPPEVEEFYKKSIRPFLTPPEEARLRQAEGRWPAFPRTLVELADRYALKLPGPVGPLRLEQLPQPQEVQKALRGIKGPGLKTVYRILEEVQDKWPEFGITLLEYYPKNRGNPLPTVSTPSRPQEFSKAIQDFLEKDLWQKLDPADRNKLKAEEGKWPQYPQKMLELARKHGLEVPEMRLPGPREFWDSYRVSKDAP
jgi:hypothetical protein